METQFAPKPFEEAARIIEDKSVVSREVFDGLLPELRGRAFTITGVQSAEVMQRVRDAIAAVPRGETWDSVKGEIAAELDPFLGEEADRRAELLLRTHTFQAAQAANWREAQEDVDTTHLQYLATEDDRVRDSHLALNGIVLPKDDPFWDKHFPPWEWGCRCRVRSMNPDLVDMEREADAGRPPEDRRVVEGPALEKLREGTLVRGPRVFDVTAPADRRQEGTAFEWHPDNLVIPAEVLEKRYDPEVWQDFVGWAKKVKMLAGESLWDWMGKVDGPRKARKGTKGKKGKI